MPMTETTERVHRRAYFAYGSNMSRRRMDARCSDHTAVGRALLDGYELLINGRGVATLKASPGGVVEGVLWLIGPADEASLDRAEGVGAGRYYGKHVLPVRMPDGTMAEALVYIDPDCACGARCRDGYADFLLDGANEFALSESYRRWLKAVLADR